MLRTEADAIFTMDNLEIHYGIDFYLPFVISQKLPNNGLFEKSHFALITNRIKTKSQHGEKNNKMLSSQKNALSSEEKNHTNERKEDIYIDLSNNNNIRETY